MKKAVLLTLGMLLLSSLVMSLAVIIFHNTQGTENRFAELSLYDRFYDLDSSIQRGFREIFTRNSGMTLTLVNDTVTITETLPHSSNFADEMNAYEDYLEETYNTDPIITVDDSILTMTKNELPVYIMPHNILIEHSPFPSGNLEITPQNLNVENYNISLTIESITFVSFDDVDMNPGSLSIKISVVGKGSSFPSTWEEFDVDPSSSTMTLNFLDAESKPLTMTITLDNYAHLTINRNSIETEHSIEIALTHQTEEMNYIKYDDRLFTINFPRDSLQKTSTARLL